MSGTGELVENVAEFVMEGLDGDGEYNWSRMKGGAKTMLGKSDRKERDDRNSKRESKKSDYSRRKSLEDGRYDNDWNQNAYEGERARYGGGRPGMPRRTSSLDRGRYSEDRRDRRNRYSEDSEPDARRERRKREEPDGLVAKSKRKLEGVFSPENDTTATIATGLAAVGTVLAASKLLEAYQDRNKKGSRSSRRR